MNTIKKLHYSTVRLEIDSSDFFFFHYMLQVTEYDINSWRHNKITRIVKKSRLSTLGFENTLW